MRAPPTWRKESRVPRLQVQVRVPLLRASRVWWFRGCFAHATRLASKLAPIREFRSFCVFTACLELASARVRLV